MRLDRRPVVAATVAYTLVLAGCVAQAEEPAGFADTAAPDTVEPSAPATTSEPPAAPEQPSDAELDVTTEPPDGGDAEIFEAYVAYWRAVLEAGAVPDPEHDRLLEQSTDPQQGRVVSSLEEMQQDGERFAGTFRVSPNVVSVTGVLAQLEDCIDGRDSYHIDASGEEVADSRGSLTAVEAELVAEADGWVVGDIHRVTERECAGE